MKIIPGFNDYAISKNGEIFRISYPDSGNQGKYKTPHKLTPKLDKYGYYTVKLSVKRKVYYRTVHRLVAETFIPNPNELPQVNHIDGNKTNNSVDNLEWVTPRQNVTHAHLIGLHNGNCTKVVLKRGTKIKHFNSIVDGATFLDKSRDCFRRHLTTDSRHGEIDGWQFELIGGKNRAFKVGG